METDLASHCSVLVPPDIVGGLCERILNSVASVTAVLWIGTKCQSAVLLVQYLLRSCQVHPLTPWTSLWSTGHCPEFSAQGLLCQYPHFTHLTCTPIPVFCSKYSIDSWSCGLSFVGGGQLLVSGGLRHHSGITNRLVAVWRHQASSTDSLDTFSQQ